MSGSNFEEAIRMLNMGCIIRSYVSDRLFKKFNGDYYYSNLNDREESREWKLCRLDEGLFTSGEVQCSWRIII